MSIIKDVIANRFASGEGATTLVTDTQSPMMKSLISRAGDLSKNNDRLKFALVSIRYPQQYDETLAKEGHPSVFLKILHWAFFNTSPTVKQFLFTNGVDPDIIHLNDMKFFKAIVYILVSQFGYKTRTTVDQFFKYGFAE
jgi:hypothetical protein